MTDDAGARSPDAGLAPTASKGYGPAMLRPALVGLLCLATACSGGALSLRRVVLYQNGVGYFERRGTTTEGALSMTFASHEVDDVLSTLTVLDAAGGETVGSASVPARADGEGDVRLDLRFVDQRSRSLIVSYAVPTPAWRAAYRIVLPEHPGERATFQAWALVHNASAEPWERVALSLATRAPFSFAVDLRTPQFVPRPDVTGHMVTPVLSGAVHADRGAGGDEDGDGVADVRDVCPAAPEDRDGFEDEDGCPDPDDDGDRIADRDDRCPREPETYNGTEDEDGCPDRGRVVISEDAIQILEQIYFADRSAEIDERSQPVIDAVAATLIGNPQITGVRIAGHTAPGEPDAWALSAERAGAVRAALIASGVDSSRLVAEAFAATQPIDPRATADALERNRRVEFHLEAEAPAGGAITAGAALSSTASDAAVRGPEGDVRFELSAPVTVPAHSSALVTLFSTPVDGSEVLLYRPDASAFGSALHPYRAAEITIPSELTLIAGTAAVYARGTFVGEGLIDHAEPGERSTIPFGLDETTTIEVRAQDATEPVRIVSAAGDSLRVEDRRVRTTTYAIDPGGDAPSLLVLHHPRQPGTEPRDLPPRAELRANLLVLGVPITAGTASTFEVAETSSTIRVVSVLRTDVAMLTAYLDGSAIDPAIAGVLRGALRHREALETAQTSLDALRSELADAGSRTAELRANLRSVTSADLRRALAERLREAAATSERLSSQIATVSAQVTALRVALAESLAGLRIDEADAAPPR